MHQLVSIARDEGSFACQRPHILAEMHGRLQQVAGLLPCRSFLRADICQKNCSRCSDRSAALLWSNSAQGGPGGGGGGGGGARSWNLAVQADTHACVAGKHWNFLMSASAESSWKLCSQSCHHYDVFERSRISSLVHAASHQCNFEQDSPSLSSWYSLQIAHLWTSSCWV